MLSHKDKKITPFIILSIFILLMLVVLFLYSPEEIIGSIGVKNSYLLMSLIAFISGYSSGGSVLLITTLTTMIIAGLNPFYLWIISSINLVIGDIIIFNFGLKGRELVGKKIDRKINKITTFFKEKKWLRKSMPLFSYIYIGLTPLPNDILLLFLAGIKFPPRLTTWIIILGDITFIAVVILATLIGIGLI